MIGIWPILRMQKARQRARLMLVEYTHLFRIETSASKMYGVWCIPSNTKKSIALTSYIARFDMPTIKVRKNLPKANTKVMYTAVRLKLLRNA